MANHPQHHRAIDLLKGIAGTNEKESPLLFHLDCVSQISAWLEHHLLCLLAVLRSDDQFRKLPALLLWPHCVNIEQ